MDVRSLNVTPVSHFVKAKPLDKNFFLIFSKKVSAYLDVFHQKKKEIFKHDEQKGRISIKSVFKSSQKQKLIEINIFYKIKKD